MRVAVYTADDGVRGRQARHCEADDHQGDEHFDEGTYEIHDGEGGYATSTVSVLVGPAAGTQPTAVNDTISTTVNTSKAIDPRSNDSDPTGLGLTVTSVTQPRKGSATKTATSVTYTPEPGFSGRDGFTYTITDSQGKASSATISVTVQQNIDPVAVADAITVSLNTAYTFNPAANDTDPDGGTPTVLNIATQPTRGTAVRNSGTSVTYTPGSSFTSGTDSFTYTVSDGQGGTSIGTVTVTMQAGVAELTPTEWTASSINTSWTGLTVAKMKDGDFSSFTSSVRTLSDNPAWIRADLGSVKSIHHVDVAPETTGDAAAWANSHRLEYSTDGSNWSPGPQVSGAAVGAYTTMSMPVQARYVRLVGTWGMVILGDVRFYGTQ